MNNLNNLIISESNYSCEYFDEDYIKQKNEKNRKLYNLEEKEQEIYDNQEEYSKKMFRILSMQKKQFNSKYNKLKKEGEFNTYYYDDCNRIIVDKTFDVITRRFINIYDANEYKLIMKE